MPKTHSSLEAEEQETLLGINTQSTSSTPVDWRELRFFDDNGFLEEAKSIVSSAEPSEICLGKPEKNGLVVVELLGVGVKKGVGGVLDEYTELRRSILLMKRFSFRISWTLFMRSSFISFDCMGTLDGQS